jgi:hypothetical protein
MQRHAWDVRVRAGDVMNRQTKPEVSRRKLMTVGGTAGALAAAAAVLPLAREGEPQPGSVGQKAAPEGGGYRLSEHVLRYYQTTRV